MAYIFADSFDLYSSISHLNTIGEWTTLGNYMDGSNISRTTTRFNTGASFYTYYNGNPYLGKQFSRNSSDTVWVNFAIAVTDSLNLSTSVSFYIQLLEGGVTHTTVAFLQNGSIDVRRGGTVGAPSGTGTSIATFTNAWAGGSVWQHWQIKVVIGASGEVRIRKNGDSTDTFVATGINTINTSNPYADGMTFGCQGFHLYLDDMFVFDDTPGTGTTINTWTGDIRGHVRFANGPGSVTDFSVNNPAIPVNSSATPYTYYANNVYYNKFTAIYTGTIGTITLPANAPAVGNVKMALYSDVNGAPAVLLGTTSVLSNPIQGLNTFTFPTPVNVTSDTSYWYAIISDITNTIYFTDGYASPAKSQAVTYSSGFPANAGGALTTVYCIYAIVNYTITNWVANSQIITDGDTSYTYSGTIGNTDLYAIGNMGIIPTAIFAVKQSVVTRKTDAGTRGAQTVFKSGTETRYGSSIPLNSTYTGLVTVYEQDPNTGAAWTVSGVDGIEAGIKVTS